MLTVVWRAEEFTISREDEGQGMEIEAQAAAQPVDRLDPRDLVFRAIGVVTLIAIAFFVFSLA